MKGRLPVLLVSVVFFLSFQPGEALSREQVLSRVLNEALENWHYAGEKINDSHSQRAFRLFVRNLDFSKSFLLQSDIAQLRSFEARIDDELQAGTTALAQLGHRLLQERVQQVKGFYRQLLEPRGRISAHGSIELDARKREFCRDLDELREWWRKRLLYQVLLQYADLQRQDGKSQKRRAHAAELEEKARQAVLRSSERLLEQYARLKVSDAQSIYFNAAASAFDPHSQYLPPREKEDFDIDMSGQLEGIGALLGEVDGYVKVLEIIPGSPSWLKGQPKVGDIILKVAQGADEPVDTVGMSVSDAARLVRGPKGSEVRLLLKKEDGRVLQVTMVRDVIQIKETYARSATLALPASPQRYGYVYLPKFYRDFNNGQNGRSAATDVRGELDKLKKLQVAGVILDLRNNGGGALDDAVRLAGLFLDQGPVVQVRNRHESPREIEDEDAGTVYGGPLVVLVNRLSASASEIVAAALQDYGRAVVIGAGQTFGKGTVQVMLDLDRLARENRRTAGDPLGALALTVQKYYRVSGVSTQFSGVTPDIQLPEATTYGRTGERNLDYSLANDSISPVPFTPWPAGVSGSRPRLQARSAARVAASPVFRFIREKLQPRNARHNDTRATLNLVEHLREQERLRRENDSWNDLQKRNRRLLVQPVNALPPASAEADRMNEWFGDLASDPYLDEALRVLSELVDSRASSH